MMMLRSINWPEIDLVYILASVNITQDCGIRDVTIMN